MKAAVLAFALCLIPAVAAAAPITTGVWTSVGSGPAGPDGDRQPFWDGLSWDGDTMGIGYLLDGYGGTSLEFLSDGSGGASAFRFDEPLTLSPPLYNITAWRGGTLGRRADGAFTYDSGTGRLSDSWEHAGQYALFRVVGPDATRYFLGVEDILANEARNDWDYNDYVVTFSLPAESVPEPSALPLVVVGLAALAWRGMRR